MSFTLSDIQIELGIKLSAHKIQIIAQALKTAHYFENMSAPQKHVNKDTGFKSNHYDDAFKEPALKLVLALEKKLKDLNRQWVYQDERYELINDIFLKPLGIDAHGYLA